MNGELVSYSAAADFRAMQEEIIDTYADAEESSLTRQEGLRTIFELGTVTPGTIKRTSRFGEGMPAVPIDLVSSEAILFSENNGNIDAVFVQHQLSRKSSLRLSLGRGNPRIVINDLPSMGSVEKLEAELAEIEEYERDQVDFNNRVVRAPYQGIPDPNLRFSIPTPPINVLYERLYTRPNGVGWSGEHEVVSVRKLRFNAGQGSVTSVYLSGQELDASLHDYHHINQNPVLRRRIRQDEKSYRSEIRQAEQPIPLPQEQALAA